MLRLKRGSTEAVYGTCMVHAETMEARPNWLMQSASPNYHEMAVQLYVNLLFACASLAHSAARCQPLVTRNEKLTPSLDPTAAGAHADTRASSCRVSGHWRTQN